MNKVKSVLRCLPTKPSKKTPLWYYIQEVCGEQVKGQELKGINRATASENKAKIKKSKIWECWNNMAPEAKRKYFNMAQVDEVKYREHQALWVSKVGPLLVKNGLTVEEIQSMSQSSTTDGVDQKEDKEEEENSQESIELYRYKRDFERMIQTRSTIEIYKKTIAQMKQMKANTVACKEDLISTIPDKFRPILHKPRRPSTPALIFACDEKERLVQLRKEKYSNTTFLACACKEWLNLSPERKKHYETIYKNLLEEYHEAMGEFKREYEKSIGSDYLEQASKEKRCFQRSIRRKLRKSSVVPLNARNAFNFFVMENKGQINELVEIWRQLPDEEKERYRRISREDMVRYHTEKLVYDKMMKNLLDQPRQDVNKCNKSS